jgi:glycosidase
VANRVIHLVSRACLLALGISACDPTLGAEDGAPNPPTTDVPDGSVATPGAADAATETSAVDASSDQATPAPPRFVSCSTTFRYEPPAGRTVTTVAVTGEWNGFQSPGVPLKRGTDGVFTTTLELGPRLTGYKLLVDGNYELDPASTLRKYVDGVENSAVEPADCRVPALELESQTKTRLAAGKGAYEARVRFLRAHEGPSFDGKNFTATLLRDGEPVTIPVAVDASAEPVRLSVTGLADGKYTLVVQAKDGAGKAAKPLRLIFWIEAEAFDWKDALIYMVMIDRFANGDSANDGPATNGIDPRVDWQGGDLEGVRKAIANGTLDALGVRALWFSPFNTNPTSAFLAADRVHRTTGYHGYWPVKAREVDARFGGESALKALVKEAHAHGIRILQDFVINHVHAEHEYFRAHPDWFRTGCVCGTDGCDWTGKRLECLFTDYLPDVNWSVAEVAEQFADDAVYWLDHYDLDGLRVDAVKHVEDLAVMNMSTKIRREFEAAGNRVFLTGETAMGWNDCGVSCNASEYGTISRYIGPMALDGQFDFVLYHAVPYRSFAYGDRGLIHVDYWTQQSQSQYPKGSIMTPYIGSHDTARFISYASYRGQAGLDRSIPGNQWDNIAAAPTSSEPYGRHALALGWLFTIPGAPLLYYGDEYAEFGGADPNNRRMWRGADPRLNADEQGILALTKKLGQARKELVALRRGDYVSLSQEEGRLVYARQAGPNDVAIVALFRDGGEVSVSLPGTLGLRDGTVLRDRAGGDSVTVSGGALRVARSSNQVAVFAR